MNKEIPDFILSKRVLLRPIAITDVEDIFSYRSLTEVAKYQYWEPFTKEQTLDFVNRNSNPDFRKRGEWIGLAIISKDTGKLIGDCALKIEDNRAEIGCNISPKYQNCGFAKEILRLLIDYSFKITGVNEVYGITDSANTASIRLMESVGMVRTPVFEERIICKGILSVEHRYSIQR
jgi:RimJ/RimL family protein N-acetyltransferase